MNNLSENSARGRVLVVDDEAMYAEMLYGILRQHNYATDMFTDSKEALDVILENDYRLIVTDYQMPGLNGVQLVEKIRAAGLSIPIIIISGMMHTPELQRAVNMGITSVLQKPTVTSAFLSHVNKYLPRARGKNIEALSSDESIEEEEGELALAHDPHSVFTFPTHLKHLTAHSLATKRSLQRLWDASRSLNQLFFKVPTGGDALQFAWELSNWKGFDEVPLNFINISELSDPSHKDRLDDLAKNSKLNELVVIDCQSKQLDQHISALNRHIETAHQYSSGSRELTFLYWFSDESWDQFLELQSANIRKFCAKNVVEIPPLSERLPDLATYASQFAQSYARRLKRSKRHEFEADAINLVLNTEWKGNYSELSLALFKVVSIGDDVPIGADELAKCISGEAVDIVERSRNQEGSTLLKSFLCGIQNRFIQRSSKDSSLSVASFYAAGEELLYPDLVSTDPEAAA
ncbi:MAG: response regulator [Opitutales bacterium]